MDQRIKNFWYQDDDTIIEKVTKLQIQEIENKINKKLPDSFKEIYLISNGGIAYFEGIEINGEIYSLFDFIPVNKIISQNRDGEIPKNVYIFSGDAHSWYALDYRKSEQPEVIYYDEFSDKIYTIADSFDNFIKQLIEVKE